MLESFFENRERLNDETAEDSKTANKKKAAFKRKYQKNKKLKKKFNPTPHKKKENTKGLPCWSSDKESTFQCKGCGFSPGRGTKIPHAMGQKLHAPQLLSSRTPTREPVCHKLQSPRALEAPRHSYRAHVPWSLRATTRERKPARHN